MPLVEKKNPSSGTSVTLVPIVIGKYTAGRFKVNIYTLNSYSTSTIDFSLVSKCVQN